MSLTLDIFETMHYVRTYNPSLKCVSPGNKDTEITNVDLVAKAQFLSYDLSIYLNIIF